MIESAIPEEWRDVESHEGLYVVSSLGRVKSLPRRTTPGGILKTYPQCAGFYSQVTLTLLGKQTKHYVHHLVAAAFIGSRPEGEVVRHLDGEPSNNAAANLAYGSQQKNMQDMIEQGRGHVAKTHCPKGHPYDEANTTWCAGRGGRKIRRCKICDHARKQRWQEENNPARGIRTRFGRLPGAGQGSLF